MTAPVLVERRGAVTLVTLNRPQRRNGVTLAMCEAFHTAVREVAASDARVVVLSGAGENFCVGADIGGGIIETETGDTPPATPPDPAIYHAATLLHTMPQIT
ncbi:enoyl-CoA hydratase/isomerase family protein, partial [Novosphingobium sp. 18052]